MRPAERRFRAWRFVHPDFDIEQGRAGLRLSPHVGIDMVSEEESIRQAVLLLLSTHPGERIMRPAYGCWLNRLIFSPNDDTTAGLAIHYVRQALARWEPRIDVIDVDARPHPEEATRLEVTLTYRVKATRSLDGFVFPVELAGEPVA